MHITYDTNTIGRDFVVGDLHGEYDKLMGALERVDFNTSTDRLFSVGDLIDRGPNSADCIRLLQEDYFHAVKGNHEDMMAKAFLGHNKFHWGVVWNRNGGGWFPREYFENNVGIGWAKELDELPITITINMNDHKIGISHAQPPVSNDWNDVDVSEEELLWGRKKISAQDTTTTKNIYWTFHGHTPLDNVVTLGNSTFLDTGACFGGELTLLQISENGNFISPQH